MTSGPTSFSVKQEIESGAATRRSSSSSSTPHPLAALVRPAGAAAAEQRFPWLAGCVVALIVLAALCAVVSAIYFYIYYTRIKVRTTSRRPSSSYAVRKRSRETQRSPGDYGGDRGASTHMFLFKK